MNLLIVAAHQGACLVLVLDERTRNQGIDKTHELLQQEGQVVESPPRIDKNIGTCRQDFRKPLKERLEGGRLLGRLAPRYGDSFDGFPETSTERHDLGNGGVARHRSPSVCRDTTWASQAATLKPDSDSFARSESRYRKMNA